MIHLRHLDRRQLNGPEQAGGIGRELAFHTQTTHIVEHRAYAKVETETCAGNVIRVRQGQTQWHLTVEGLVVVLRYPIGDAAFLPDQRRVVERRHQCVTPWLHERGEVGHWLQQRPDRTLRIKRAIESFEACITPADQGLYLAILGIGDDHGAFEATGHLARTLDVRQPLRQCPLGAVLYHRIKGGENMQAF